MKLNDFIHEGLLHQSKPESHRAREEVSILDQPAKGFSMEETVKWVEDEGPELVGFSPFGTSSLTAAHLGNEIKERLPDTTIVYGNYHATFNAERILRNYPFVDIIVRGEGEQTIIDLVESKKGLQRLEETPGITFRKGGEIVSTPDRVLIKDLDSIPIPDRSLLEEDYHNNIAGARIAVKKFTSVISSRGCVHRCRFCSCSEFSQGVWRPRSVENTIEELTQIANEGYEQFIFVDDSFTLNQKRVIELCRRMREERLDFEWICEGRVDSCSPEMFREMTRTGCKIVFFGIESANQRILDYYNKRITPQMSMSAMRVVRKAGIDLIHGSFILGAPDETREEIRNTLEFAKRLPIDIPQFNILGAWPGTSIWDELNKKGFIDEDLHWESPIAASKICPQAVPFEEIRKMGQKALGEFIKRPSYILAQIARSMKSGFRRRIIVNNLGRLGEVRGNIRHIV
jgi:radical SAM superfamily enzyme YgiQ (UPF0313 family)